MYKSIIVDQIEPNKLFFLFEPTVLNSFKDRTRSGQSQNVSHSRQESEYAPFEREYLHRKQVKRMK